MDTQIASILAHTEASILQHTKDYDSASKAVTQQSIVNGIKSLASQLIYNDD